MVHPKPSAPAAALHHAFRRANIGERRCVRYLPATAPARLCSPRPSPTHLPRRALLYSRARPSFPASRLHTLLPVQPPPPPPKRQCRLSSAFQPPTPLPPRNDLPAAARCLSTAGSLQIHLASLRTIPTNIQVFTVR